MDLPTFSALIRSANDLPGHRFEIDIHQEGTSLLAKVFARRTSEDDLADNRLAATIETHGTELVMLELGSAWFRPFFWDDEATPPLVAEKLMELVQKYVIGSEVSIVTRRTLLQRKVQELRIGDGITAIAFHAL